MLLSDNLVISLQGHIRKGHRDALVAAAALEADDEVIQVAGVPEHSRVASEGVTDLDLVRVSAVDVDEGHRRVSGEVEEVLSTFRAVSSTRGAAHSSFQNIRDVVRVRHRPLVVVVELVVEVEVGHGEYQP